MSNFGINLPKTAFGESQTANMQPIVQINAVYGFLDNVDSFISTTGTVTANNQMFDADTGISPAGIAYIFTKNLIGYREGQGSIARFSALFSAGVANNNQIAGLITSEDRLGFGFNGVDFGIQYGYNGIVEQQDLTITTPASGSETATVTINGFAFSVPLTSGSTSHNAYEIAVSLTVQDPLHTFESIGNVVRVISTVASPESSYLFSSASAVGSFVQNFAGTLVTSEWINQADWNGDSITNLNPLLGNLYQIQFQYLGFGDVKFYIQDSETSSFTLVHTIKYVNTSTTTIISNPNFNLGWLTFNFGNTIPISIKGASASAFIEGNRKQLLDSKGIDVVVTGVGTTETSLLIIRNPTIFNSRLSKANILPSIMSIATNTTKTASFRVIMSPIFTGSINYQQISPTNVLEFALDNLPVMGGDVRMSFNITKESSQIIDIFNKIILRPGEIICIAAKISSGSSSGMATSLTYVEDQ